MVVGGVACKLFTAMCNLKQIQMDKKRHLTYNNKSLYNCNYCREHDSFTWKTLMTSTHKQLGYFRLDIMKAFFINTSL